MSTGQQREAGLGLEAQIAQVRDYVAANHGRLIGEHSETAGGRRDNRPALANALNLCRIARATLMVARLDRLSRSVTIFIQTHLVFEIPRPGI
jgi:DNA invertase Pin-like site-specific DNA recombinase